MVTDNSYIRFSKPIMLEADSATLPSGLNLMDYLAAHMHAKVGVRFDEDREWNYEDGESSCTGKNPRIRGLISRAQASVRFQCGPSSAEGTKLEEILFESPPPSGYSPEVLAILEDAKKLVDDYFFEHSKVGYD